ncbi:MAG: tetratricopeptide repeat protein [Methylobacter sp.]|nr:tetratricopeptide repeat protein [Methylobacter sp.]
MKPNNLRKKQRLFKKAVKEADKRKKQGFFEGAALAYLEAAKLLPQDEFPEHVAACFNNAGLAYRHAKKNPQAEDYLLQALAIREKILGAEHIDTADSLNNLGNIYYEKGEFDKAEQHYQRALIIREKILGNNNPDLASTLNNLGTLYVKKRMIDKAGIYYQRAKDVVEKSFLKPHNPVAETITKNHRNLQQEITHLEREKLEIHAALYQSKKLEYLGQMATLMAHNINQPIGVIRMATSGALGDLNENLFDPATELKPLLENILNQTERLNLIMGNFRNFARGDRTVLSAVNLNTVIEDIYQLLFAAQYQLDKIECQKGFIEAPIAHANELAIQEMLISLLSNARAAVKDQAIKQVRIGTWQQNSQVGFAVEDNGDGITEENLPKLFTPFLSSKHEGMGLGLYFCREIVKDLGGSIDYYPAPLGGAGFKIALPAEQENKNDSAI